MDPATDISARWTSYASGLQFARLPACTVHAAKRAILDGLGVMLAASGESRDVRPFIELALSLSGAPQATVLGEDVRVSVAQAAFANGAMAHALDFEDAFDRAPVHPNASLLPAALALSQSRGPCSGREFITAVALGCDLVCRLSLSLRRPMEAGGWYPPPMLGAYGAVTAAARLLQLSALQLRDAWSLLLCQNTCAGELKYSPDSTLRAVREAFPAQAAVLSALLAERGVRGFEQPLEGRNGFYQLYVGGEFEPGPLFERLGEHFWIDELSFKPWPCCRGTHAYIEAAQRLRHAHAFALEDVLRIELAGGPIQQMLTEPRQQKLAPQTIIDAKFSLPFTLALALHEAQIGLASFSVEALRSPTLLSLAARCVFTRRADWDRRHAAAGEVTLHLRDGRTFHECIVQAAGEPSRALSDQQLQHKFADCARRAARPWTQQRIERCTEAIWRLDEIADVAVLLNAPTS